ncbi:MAG: type I-E CRISPR-associated protein Cas7/Cse4/CasC [Eubacteriales bacterium]|nr:type I-E CRISPR-associated protein Cas7/Cse4/CasC [Eubacteriales bacterium]
MMIELHMLKSFPPVNLNRDESGSPKSCFFGGSQRGRISSQSLKHSWRSDSEIQKLPLGVRTRRLADLISDRLAKDGISKEAIAAIAPRLSGFGNKDAKESEDGLTSQIMFFSQADLDAITDILKNLVSGKEIAEIKKIKVGDLKDALSSFTRPITADMALFGRMITDAAFKDVEASLQVAHAISTHVVNMESDFFTAVDDLQKLYGADGGSAMMGDTDFNSCTYYFYASLDVDQLLLNLDGMENREEVVLKLLPGLISAMVFSNPSGKQNTFAGHSLPGLVCAQLKERKVPVSHANAFEKPVRGREGFMAPSIRALKEHMDVTDKSFGLPVVSRLWFAPGCEAAPQHSKVMDTLPQLMDEVKTWLKEG